MREEKKIHFVIPGQKKMQVNSHQLRKQPIALELNELKINQPNRKKSNINFQTV